MPAEPFSLYNGVPTLVDQANAPRDGLRAEYVYDETPLSMLAPFQEVQNPDGHPIALMTAYLPTAHRGAAGVESCDEMDIEKVD